MKRKKKYVGVVNGNVVYKWADSVEEYKRLCMREAMASVGRCIISDYRVIKASPQSSVSSRQ